MEKVLIFWLFLTMIGIAIQQAPFQIPDLTFEPLKTGEVRVYIPHKEGIKKFEFHANKNDPILRYQDGEYFMVTDKRNGDFWIITLNMPVELNDTVYYWISLIVNKAGFVTDSSFTVENLQDSYKPLRDPHCEKGVTIMDNGESSCIGWTVLEDDFNGPSVDTLKWLIHHKIPTYSGPNFEFNSYLNQDDTRFVKDGKLYLKPIPFTNENDIRGILNLTDKCTSSTPSECTYKQKFSYILPPVKSAKITSKTSFKYGKIEIKAKLPSGDWIVPIIELEDKAQMSGQNSPKVWIAYSRGNKVLKGYGSDDYGSRLLFGGPVIYPVEPIRSRYLASKYGAVPFSNDFHVYTLEWKPGKMILYIDNEVFGDVSTNEGFTEYTKAVKHTVTEPEAPYDREYFLSLGVAIGGIYDFPDGFNSENDPKPWSNTEGKYVRNFFDARNAWMKTWHGDDVALQVDYVKIVAI